MTLLGSVQKYVIKVMNIFLGLFILTKKSVLFIKLYEF